MVSRSSSVAAALRCLTILAVITLAALLITPTLHASSSPPQASVAEAILWSAANRDRAAVGLRPLEWDAALAAAAHRHALRLVERNRLSHQFPGEPPVEDRARQAGARFSLIAENVAEGPDAPELHAQWMNSPPHRANLLDPELNVVGIAAVQRGNILFAVEDFATAIPRLTLEAQESRVGAQIAARGIPVVDSTADARRTCGLDRGWAGQRPGSVLRYETADLNRLPEDIERKVSSGKYHSAAVGACDTGRSAGFAYFRIAILLY